MKMMLHTPTGKRSFWITLCTLLLSLCLVMPILADTNIDLNSIVIENEDEISGNVYDGAGLLTDDQISSLSDKLAEIEDQYQCDVAILTLEDANGYEVYDYAKAIYKRCGYGYGSDKDGIMFIVSMAERRSELIAFGYGSTALTDYGREYILDEVAPTLSDGDYNKAFNTFADLISVFLKEARENIPYDVDHPAKLTLFSRLLPYLMSFGIALIVAAIVCSVLIASMKTASKKHRAAEYMEPGSFHLTKKRDYYLYTTTHRVKREKQENSSGGSNGGGGTTVDSDGFSGSGRNF